MSKKKSIKIALDENIDVFIVHLAYLNTEIFLDLTQKAQIALLIAKKVFILVKYLDFRDIFPKKLAAKLFECFDINKYLINLELGKQSSYKPIYSFSSVELKTLKTYIKINLASGFIHPLKFLARVPILFIQIFNGNLYLCVNY